MLQLIDKKIYLYVSIFFLLGTISNKYILNFNLFQIQEINILGLESNSKNKLQKNLQKYKLKNIFQIEQNEIENIIFQDKKIESFEIFKKYPSELYIEIKKTDYLANINFDDKFYFIGSNKKLIRSNTIDKNLPIIFGKPSIDKFMTIREKIIKSKLEISDIRSFFFFNSGRWDLELLNGHLIKLPIELSETIINEYLNFSKLEIFKKNKIFDMRIKKQLIVNDNK